MPMDAHTARTMKKEQCNPNQQKNQTRCQQGFFALLTMMRAKGKVVQGLASRRGHRAYINSLSEKAKTELVADKAEEAELLQGRDVEMDCEKTKRT